jgi:hypothetical protein
MSSPTTLSPAFQSTARATRFRPQLVDGTKPTSDVVAPMNRAATSRARSIRANQTRQSAAPRSRVFSVWAAMVSATRRGRGETAAWLK